MRGVNGIDFFGTQDLQGSGVAANVLLTTYFTVQRTYGFIVAQLLQQGR